MLAVIALIIAIVGVLAAGGAYIKIEQHHQEDHGTKPGSTSNTPTGCIHSTTGCACYQLGHNQTTARPAQAQEIQQAQQDS